MHFLPTVNPSIGLHDITADSHVGIQVPNVVNERAICHARNKCARNASYRRIRHGKNDVRVNSQRARDSEREIGQII